jgi:putative CocE/NonD family hydrolase
MSTQVSSEKKAKIQIEYNVPIPMRDGTILRANIYRPTQEGKYPVLVERVCYELTKRAAVNGQYYAEREYVLVAQTVRGAYASEGQFSFLQDDGWGANRDGYDTIEWAGTQPWSNGRVGMIDGSFSGMTQYMLLPTRPQHLIAVFVREATGDLHRAMFRSGVYEMYLSRTWAMSTVLGLLRYEGNPPSVAPVRARLEAAMKDLDSWLSHLPLKSFPPLDTYANLFSDGLSHPSYGPYWWSKSLSLKYQDVDVPALHLGGWFCVFLDSTIRAYQGIRAYGRSERCRDNQRLLIGPWIHGPSQVGVRNVGELDFGEEAVLDLNEIRSRWYDYWLKGIDNGVMDGFPIRIFLMGANRWVDLETWPPPNIDYKQIYLREGSGNPTVSLNDGALSFKLPAKTEHPDSYIYDPDEPIQSLLKYPMLGPRDHRKVEEKMLTYTTEELNEDLILMGPVKAYLYGLSSANDTDWIVRLCDVWPDGKSMSMCDGILRARYRDSLEYPELLTPEKVYRYEIDLWSTAQVFKAGHKVRVEVTSSDFPRYDRNMNTGGIFGEEVRGKMAINTVFHDAMRPSHLVLPILNEG